MIRSIDELFFELSQHSVCAVRTLMARMEELEDSRFDEAIEWVKGQGWEEIDSLPKELIKAPSGRQYLSDGREVMETQRRFFVMSKEESEKRIKVEMEIEIENAKNLQLSSSSLPVEYEEIFQLTCTQIIDGKPCGGALNSRSVCPSCELGRLGYKHRYSCELCDFDIVSKNRLRL